ncbi:MAG: hypothetical protein WD078_11705 [Woeseia sp.]|nr:hypothetical protein [Woeseiaceae bacterium]
MPTKQSERNERNDREELPVGDEIDEDDVEQPEDDTLNIRLSDDDDDDDDADDDGDLSSELNVEELLAQLERTKSDDIARKKEIRRRLEEIQEERSLEDTYSFDLNGDD